MKLLSLALMFISLSAFAQDKDQVVTQSETQVVEASCGQCNFGMEGQGCSLAVKIDGKAYWVDGSSIHDHGDAHGAHGFCNSVRKAEVKGEIVDDRFAASEFKVLPVKKEKKKGHEGHNHD